MKKIISLVLVLVLVFSLAVPSFAYPQSDTEMEALNEIEYWTYWIHQDFTGFFNDANDWLSSIWQVLTNSIASNVVLIESDVDSLAQNVGTLVTRSESSLSNLLDINEFIRSINTEISSLNDNLFGNIAFLTPFAQVLQNNSNSIKSNVSMLNDYFTSFYSEFSKLAIGGSIIGDWRIYKDSWFSFVYNDIHQLKEVLADDEDLAFKESQKKNQQYVQDTFFSSSSDLSLNLDDFGILTQYVREFKTGYNFEENIGNPLPLTLINTESDFKDWFSDSTGQAMDPTFGGGSGGGGETPGPDDSDDPDDPDPPTPTIKNWLPLATTEPGGTEIYNGIGYKPDTRWSASSNKESAASGFFLTGWIPVTSGDVVYTYDILFNSPSWQAYYVKFDGTIYVSEAIDSSSVDENGVCVFSVPNGVISVRFSCSSIIADSMITINQYPIQTASTFSLRAQSVSYEPEIVTSYYADRLLEVERIKGGNK